MVAFTAFAAPSHPLACAFAKHAARLLGTEGPLAMAAWMELPDSPSHRNSLPRLFSHTLHCAQPQWSLGFCLGMACARSACGSGIGDLVDQRSAPWAAHLDPSEQAIPGRFYGDRRRGLGDTSPDAVRIRCSGVPSELNVPPCLILSMIAVVAAA